MYGILNKYVNWIPDYWHEHGESSNNQPCLQAVPTRFTFTEKIVIYKIRVDWKDGIFAMSLSNPSDCPPTLRA